MRSILPSPSDAAYHLYFTTDTKGTRVWHDYVITPLTLDTCTVTDLVALTTGCCLRGYICRTARSAHGTMMARLPQAVKEFASMQ